MAKLEPRWNQHGEARSGQDGQVGAKTAQESAKMEPRWPNWSQDGANMAPRCQRCVYMGRHCAYLEKAKKLSFSLVFVDFRNPKGASSCPREGQGQAKMAKLEPRWLRDSPRNRQDGQVGAKREPTWLQDGPRCAKMEPKERQDGAKMAKSEPKWS